MTQTNILNDVATLSKVPNKVVEELVNKEMLCIGSAINDAKINGEDVAILNIGLGTLSIDLKQMQTKFIPSKELKKVIKWCLDNDKDLLEFELEQSMITKLLGICDGII